MESNDNTREAEFERGEEISKGLRHILDAQASCLIQSSKYLGEQRGFPVTRQLNHLIGV